MDGSAKNGNKVMMNKQVLITGGAGFIGSHLADHLLAHGYRVRALDTLEPQMHGPDRERPEYLDPDVELQVGDVRNPDAVRRALDGIDVVFHFASLVGVGQSMYNIAHYTSVNNLGTAVLLEALVERPVERLVVASSMSLYGEGLYQSADGSIWHGQERGLDQLKAGDWEVRNGRGEILKPVPTSEAKNPSISSVYALSKYDQERMCLMTGRAYGIPTVALRFFNVYGSRQALSNPYTGVLAIFSSRLLNNNPPVIFEDGEQQRDFASVYDIARACHLALESANAPGEVLNIGSGEHLTIRQVAESIASALGKQHIGIEVTGKYRIGDVRHCFADISRARQVLGYDPHVSLDAGLVDLVSWLEGQDAVDRVADASAELVSRGLTL